MVKLSGLSEENGFEKLSKINIELSELFVVEQGVVEGIFEEEYVQQDF